MTAKSFDVEKLLLRTSLDNLMREITPITIKGFMGVSCFVTSSKLPDADRNQIIYEACKARETKR